MLSLKTTVFTAFFAASLPAAAWAQRTPELPAPSLGAKVHQRVGLTDIEVDYSSPGVKGRAIWGKLVPFKKMWRAGANKATKVSFSEDVTIAGKKVAAGDYSLFAMPGAKSWTLILNKNTELWGTSGYDKKMDAVRIKAKPVAIPSRERLAYIFSNSTNDGTRLDLEWEKLRVSIPIKVNTKAQVAANIDKAVKAAGNPHMRSAQYLLDNGGNLKTARQYIDKSIAIRTTWRNQWIKAQILAKLGDKKGAGKLAQAAYKQGDDSGAFRFYGPKIKKAAKDWK